MTKKEVRAFQKKRILEIQNRFEKEEKIKSNLLARLQSCKKILAYRADLWEVNLDSIWENSDSKDTQFYFPRVTSIETKSMEFIRPSSWEIGAYGLSEPVGTDKISPEEADLLIVPALGFNEKGFRLGRGAGFYDRAFQNIKPKKMIGISFLELFSIDFPSSDYDIRVGELVTDSGVLFF